MSKAENIDHVIERFERKYQAFELATHISKPDMEKLSNYFREELIRVVQTIANEYSYHQKLIQGSACLQAWGIKGEAHE